MVCQRLAQDGAFVGWSGRCSTGSPKLKSATLRGPWSLVPDEKPFGCGSKAMVPFWVGASPMLVYFSGDWDVHWGYGILTHGHLRGGDSNHLQLHQGGHDLQ